MYNGYDFHFKIGSKLLTLPITPNKLTITNSSNNKVITLINEGDVNILKSPSLTEIEFDARFPMRKYPFSRDPDDFEDYFKEFTKVKEKKKSCRFSVVRRTPNGKNTWGTSFLVSIEELKTTESADEGDDVIVTFKLKQYKSYGSKTLPNSQLKVTTSTSSKPRAVENPPTGAEGTSYTIKSGDCMWNIAKKFYGNGATWKKIYEANKTVIENTAKKYRNGKDSNNGWWIYPGTKIVIPPK